MAEGSSIPVPEKRRRKSPNVPGTYAGFSQQTFRAVVHLLNARLDEVVSVEHLDDIATEGPQGVEVEQTKAGTTKNPIANSSSDLWTTFTNWLDAVESGRLDVNKTTFILSVKPGHVGPIAELFSSASDAATASNSISKVRTALSKVLTAKKSRSPIRPLLDKFFAQQAVSLRLVQNFTLVRTSARVAADIEAALETKAISRAVIPLVANQMLGWVQKRLLEQHEAGFSPAVSATEFLAELTSFARAVDRNTILHSFDPPPTDDEIQAEIPGRRTYIQQLELIECSYDQMLSAASAFLRAAADRVRWSDEGFVHEAGWKDYETALRQQWESHSGITALTHKTLTRVEQGKVVFHQCCACIAHIQGALPPAHFTPGSFHALADHEEIGWHPDFKAELRARRAALRKKAS